MRVVVLNESKKGESRVALTPDTGMLLLKYGIDVWVESGAGEISGFLDEAYERAGVHVKKERKSLLADADVMLCVNAPSTEDITLMKKGACLIGMLDPYSKDADKRYESYNKKDVTACVMELVPRITRAQSMDVLSSQSNLAGYQAVLEGLYHIQKVCPMMMTAAGTITPAKILILGAGVAGLQAIATAKRMGAVVSAFDVRAAAKEQVESLGAKFIEVRAGTNEDAETKGGYAKEMDKDYQQKQQQALQECIVTQDVVITTALIPGKPAPVLIPEAMVALMKPGSVIVDLAVKMGGNCPLSQADKIVSKHNVTLIGYTNMPGRVAMDASRLYSKNVCNFLVHLLDPDKKNLAIDLNDEITKNVVVTHQGKTCKKE